MTLETYDSVSSLAAQDDQVFCVTLLDNDNKLIDRYFVVSDTDESALESVEATADCVYQSAHATVASTKQILTTLFSMQREIHALLSMQSEDSTEVQRVTKAHLH